MNEPLKFKLFSVYGKILHKDVLTEAFKKVKKNKGCAGIDKVSIKKFEEHLEENIELILNELKTKTYKSSPVRRKYIPKKNGKQRPLGIPTIKDRIVQQALVNQLEPFFEENVFHDNSCGFRPKRDVKLAIKKIVSRLESGYLYIYDFDIKGYFDNIPHKKLMKVINKYVSDGTVLDMIWKSLKAGYMEDEIKYETPCGTQQGGVISPLLANIYLNELDWELDKAKLEFVRYADDAIVMCQTREQLEKAKQIVHETLEKLGLELAEDKSDDIDFHEEDFDFLGFTFNHLKMSKRNGVYYTFGPSIKTMKKFKSDIKSKIKKRYTYSFEKWVEILNPILRGKYNYYLIPFQVAKEMKILLEERGRCMHGIPVLNTKVLDGYVRQRLRVNFSCRGKRHGGQKQGKMLTVKYGNRFFIKSMGLVTGEYMKIQQYNPRISIDEFISFMESKKKKRTLNTKQQRYLQYAYAK